MLNQGYCTLCQYSLWCGLMFHVPPPLSLCWASLPLSWSHFPSHFPSLLAAESPSPSLSMHLRESGGREEGGEEERTGENTRWQKGKMERGHKKCENPTQTRDHISSVVVEGIVVFSLQKRLASWRSSSARKILRETTFIV